LVHWFIGSLVHWFIGSLVHWFIGSLVHWFIGSLVHWFIGSLVHKGNLISTTLFYFFPSAEVSGSRGCDLLVYFEAQPNLK